jgi:hypothetical protein
LGMNAGAEASEEEVPPAGGGPWHHGVWVLWLTDDSCDGFRINSFKVDARITLYGPIGTRERRDINLNINK